MSIAENLKRIKAELGEDVLLVAVSKYSPDAAVEEAYAAGHRDFGENKAQDLKERYEKMPKDICWHFIGHMQRNKVKYIAPFIQLIHSVDSMRLLEEIDKQAAKHDRVIPCLLQMHIAKEETKFGLDESELFEMLESDELATLQHVKIVGLMAMATNTEQTEVVEQEFKGLTEIFNKLKSSKLPQNVSMETLSMGMSGDYKIAIACGSNMVRIGSAVFTNE
jgi:pyridoxal phosphate enzyme (YggS family)